MKESNIDWCDHVINPIIGCKHNCFFGCYAERNNKFRKWVKKWNEPEIKHGWIKKLKAIKDPSRIFVGSLTDLFGDWVAVEQIQKVLAEIKQYPQHTFMFLTKNPKRYKEFYFPYNCWLGTSHFCESNYAEIKELKFTKEIKVNKKFVSFEPLLSNLLCTLQHIDWVIIGGLSGSNANQYLQKKTWVDNILREAIERDIPVFMKNNLKDVWPGKLIQEYPNE